jgi:hypothetical protein
MCELLDLQKKWYYNWLYYAGLSPLWEERLDDFNGHVNKEKKTVEFDNEDDEEKFYERWNLEPDEQPKSIQQIIIGDIDNQQLGLKEFCEKYGCPIITRILRINKK